MTVFRISGVGLEILQCGSHSGTHSRNDNYAAVVIDWVEENEHPEISANYDYYYVPAFFVDGVKVYESHRGEKYEECRENVRRVLEEALY